MPDMASGQRVLITAVGEFIGQRTMTSWLYRVSSVAGSITDVAFFNALHTVNNAAGGLLTTFRECLSNIQWTGVATWYQVLGPTRYRKVSRSLGNGIYDSDSTTANLQASITRYGEFGRRSAVGGIRVPLASNEMIDGKVSVDMMASLANLATEMMQVITAGTPLVTLIPQVGVPGYSGDPPVLTPVTNSQDLSETQVQDTVRVIRRRTLRVGI